MTEVGAGGPGVAAIGPSEVALLPPPGPLQHPEAGPSSSSTLDFLPASQAQILRSHQRDSSQIHRLSDLTSELIRSFAGTRWLATRQSTIDLLVRGIYLFLTLGRGQQTLGEEYTDVLPYAARTSRFPTRRRRILTILFLLFPAFLSSSLAHNLNPTPGAHPSAWTTWKVRLKRFIESPLGQALPELHMIAFLYGGRFFEFGRRLTGLSYVSALPPDSAGRHRSYEPLAVLMLLPLMTRLLRSRQNAMLEAKSITPPATTIKESKVPLTTDLPAGHEASVLLDKSEDYDQPNTYLTPDAQSLPERQCTLCLEPRGTGEGSGGTVAVTECGHIFCWGCLGGLERMECPLCRQTLRMERLVAAYNL